MAPRHECEGGRARTTVEILVTTTHREIGAATSEVDLDRAGGVGQVPQNHRTRVVGGRGHRTHVLHLPGPEVHVGEHQYRDVGAERPPDLATRNQPEFDAVTQQTLQPLRDVEIGPEVLDVRQDQPAAGPQVDGCGQQLEEIDRDRVGDHDLVGRGADQGRDLARHAFRQIDPAGSRPAADEATPPLLLQDSLDPRRHISRRWAQRVAVEVDHAVRQNETIAEAGDRIAAIEVKCIGS